MSFWLRRLFGGEPPRADMSEVQWLRERVEKLEAVNLDLRRENIALSNANTLAQIEAYRQLESDKSLQRRKELGYEKPEREAGPDITDSVYIGDFLAEGTVPDGMGPTEEQLLAEAQRGYREASRARGTRTETPVESDDEPPQEEAAIG